MKIEDIHNTKTNSCSVPSSHVLHTSWSVSTVTFIIPAKRSSMTGTLDVIKDIKAREINFLLSGWIMLSILSKYASNKFPRISVPWKKIIRKNRKLIKSRVDNLCCHEQKVLKLHVQQTLSLQENSWNVLGFFVWFRKVLGLFLDGALFLNFDTWTIKCFWQFFFILSSCPNSLLVQLSFLSTLSPKCFSKMFLYDVDLIFKHFVSK